MKASELIKKLKDMIKEHGDRYVYSGGEDYPGEVCAVTIIKHGDGYEGKGGFRIHRQP